MNNPQILFGVSLVAVLAFTIGYLFASGPANHLRQQHDTEMDMDMGVGMDMDMNSEMDMMAMEPVEIPSGNPVPQINIVNIFQDMMGAVTVELVIDNFAFTPELVDQAAIPNQGHGHVFVNGEQAGRVYGNWVYIPGYHFTPGKNSITVTLNANTHSQWLYSSTPIQDTFFFDYE